MAWLVLSYGCSEIYRPLCKYYVREAPRKLADGFDKTQVYQSIAE